MIGAAAHGERLQQPEEARLHAGPPVLLCIQRHRHHLAVGVPDQRQLRAEFSNILDFVNLIFDSISFWLIWQRKRLARHFIIGFSLFNIFIGTAFNIATGHFSLVGQLFSCTPDLILLAYFLTSRRAKAVLTQPFDAEVKQRELAAGPGLLPASRPGRSGATSSFTSACSAWWDTGWAAYCTLIRFGMIPGTYGHPESGRIGSTPSSCTGSEPWRACFCCTPSRTSLKKRIRSRVVPLLISFVVNARLHDHRTGHGMVNQPGLTASCPMGLLDMFCNHGQVCLQNAIAFGVVATLMTWVIYPALEQLLSKGPSRDGMNIAFIAVTVGFCILIFLYYVNVALPTRRRRRCRLLGRNLDELSSSYDSEAAGYQDDPASMPILSQRRRAVRLRARLFGVLAEPGMPWCVLSFHLSVLGHWMEIVYCSFMNVFGIVDDSLSNETTRCTVFVYGVVYALVLMPLKTALVAGAPPRQRRDPVLRRHRGAVHALRTAAGFMLKPAERRRRIPVVGQLTLHSALLPGMLRKRPRAA